MNGNALLFPGQGAQYPGMGQDLVEHFPECRDLLERAEACLELPLGTIMFSGSQEELDEDFIAQTAVYTVSCMAALVLETRNIRGSIIAPYSSGLYAAAYAAGAVDFESGIHLMREAYQCICGERIDGAMGVILGLSSSEVEELCGKVEGAVEVSIRNTHHQIIVSGERSAVNELLRYATDALTAYLLPVSAPYHCSLLKGADRCLAKVVECFPISTPHTPIISYIDGKELRTAPQVADFFSNQLSSPVQWTKVVEELGRRELTSMVEVGPGRMLNRSVRWIHRRAEVLPTDTGSALQETIKVLESAGGPPLVH